MQIGPSMLGPTGPLDIGYIQKSEAWYKWISRAIEGYAAALDSILQLASTEIVNWSMTILHTVLGQELMNQFSKFSS